MGGSIGRVRVRLAMGVALCLLGAAVAGPADATPGAAPGALAPGPSGITTVAGGGSPPDGVGNGKPATAAVLEAPWGVTESAAKTYVSEQDPGRVRVVDGAGIIATKAGGGTAPLGDGGKARDATFTEPEGTAVDSHGNAYVTDTLANRVRRIDAVTRVITTVAGTGRAGFSGDGGPATAARLKYPIRLAFDKSDNMFISDADNFRIRRVDARTGRISTVAGTGVFGSAGDGGPARAATFVPRGIAIDAANNLYLSDVGSLVIRKIAAGADGVVTGATDEIITTYAGGGTLALGGVNEGKPATQFALAAPEGITIDSGGNLFAGLVAFPRVIEVAAEGAHALTTIAGDGTSGPVKDGGPATASHLAFPYGVAVDGGGNVFIADLDSARVQRVDATTHVITTVVGTGTLGFGSYGDGGRATAASLISPSDVTFHAGNLFLVDRDTKRLRRIDEAGIITTYAGGGVNDGASAKAAVLNHPRGLAADATGNLFVADCGDARVRRITPAGAVSTVAGGGDALNVGPATSVALGCPSGVFVVSSGPDAGSLYIADSADNRIRKVTPSGTISTVAGTGAAGFSGDGGPATAASLDGPSGVTVAPNGDLLIADTANNRVRRVTAAGVISTVAGNGTFGIGTDNVAATATTVAGATDVVVDPGGNLLIAEAVLNRLRQVDQAGTITTIAGSGIPGFSGDGGPAPEATVNLPTQIHLHPDGSFVFTDRGNGRLRRVEAGTPPPPPPSGCGSVVTRSVTLAADIGPCSGDGLKVGADNITINMNGHTISGGGPGDGAHAGVRISGHRNVVITGGAGSTVRGFADGIVVIGGSHNNVNNLTIADNIGPTSPDAVFGDGIGVFLSGSNTFQQNILTHNGIYDAIGILGPLSDHNLVTANTVRDTVEAGQLSGGTGNGIIVNAFLSADFPRQVSVFGNRIISNLVEASDNSGIADIGNVDGVVVNNIVRDNGRDPNNSPRNGIGDQHLDLGQPDTRMLIANNVVTGNMGGDGILVGADQGRVLNNQVHGNGAGIMVNLLGHSNQVVGNNAADNSGADLTDLNATSISVDPFLIFDCDHNNWNGNIWGSGGFFPDPSSTDPSEPIACTTTGGHRETASHPASGRGAAARGPAVTASPDARSVGRNHTASGDGVPAPRSDPVHPY